MQLFADTADINDLAELNDLGLLDGVTTNPSLIMKTGKDITGTLKSICSLVDGPVSAEVVALLCEDMVREGETLAGIAENIVVKVPLTWEGLKACNTLSSNDISVNVTLCFSANQALLAANAGATFISPFIGRIDDLGEDGLDLIDSIRCIYDAQYLDTQILAASIRSPLHVRGAAEYGADAATMPPKVFRQLVEHPMTDKGLASFLDDWKKTGMQIG